MLLDLLMCDFECDQPSGCSRVLACCMLYKPSAICPQFSPSLGLAAAWCHPAQAKTEEDGPRSECETCNGTGYVECWCSRWSDGDGGCSTCRGTQRMVCSSCRGGGTAVPIEARLIIRRDERTSNFREYK